MANWALFMLFLSVLSLYTLVSSKLNLKFENSASINKEVLENPSKEAGGSALTLNFLQLKMEKKAKAKSTTKKAKSTTFSASSLSAGVATGQTYAIIPQYTEKMAGNVTASYVGPNSTAIANETLGSVEEIVESLKDETNFTLNLLSNYSDSVQSDINETFTRAMEVYEETVEETRASVIEATEEELQNLDLAAAVIDERIQDIKAKVASNEQQTDQLEIDILQGQIRDFESELKDILRRIAGQRSKVNTTTVCSTFTDCSSCAAFDNCGWCTVEQKCVDGDAIGPFTETCSFYSFGSCNEVDCSVLKNCNTCITNSNCGWCADHTVNATMCIEREADYEGCPRNDWYHSQGENTICEALPYLQKISAQLETDESTTQNNNETEAVAETSLIPVAVNAVTRKNQDILLNLEYKADILQGKIDQLESEINDLQSEIVFHEVENSADEVQFEIDREKIARDRDEIAKEKATTSKSTKSLLEIQNQAHSKTSTKRNKRSHFL